MRGGARRGTMKHAAPVRLTKPLTQDEFDAVPRGTRFTVWTPASAEGRKGGGFVNAVRLSKYTSDRGNTLCTVVQFIKRRDGWIKEKLPNWYQVTNLGTINMGVNNPRGYVTTVEYPL